MDIELRAPTAAYDILLTSGGPPVVVRTIDIVAFVGDVTGTALAGDVTGVALVGTTTDTVSVAE